MVTEESGKKSQVERGATTKILHLENAPLRKHISSTSRKIYLFFQEYVTEERLEVPVEFDEGINNLLKKIEVVTSLKFIL